MLKDYTTDLFWKPISLNKSWSISLVITITLKSVKVLNGFFLRASLLQKT